MQPLIKALPLTPLIDSLRAVMLEGASHASRWPELAILSAYAIVCFALALWSEQRERSGKSTWQEQTGHCIQMTNDWP